MVERQEPRSPALTRVCRPSWDALRPAYSWSIISSIALYPIDFVGCFVGHPRFMPALTHAFSVAGEAGAMWRVGTSRARRGRIGVVRLMACANANRSALR